MLACALILGVGFDAQAQNKKGSKAKSGQTIAKKKKKKAAPAPEKPLTIDLPYNCNDCLFAIPLELDKPYGPTSSPMGGGRIQEVVADKAHPNLFEREHNSVWYKIKVPYNGYLEISIAQQNVWDDYDFLVYKNTGSYFSNQVMLNKVMPVAVNLAAVDSNTLAAAALAAQQPKKAAPKGSATTAKGTATTAKKSTAKADDTPAFEAPAELKPTIGMAYDATAKMLTKKQYGGFIKSIPVRMGEEYYIVLDNTSDRGQGHTIQVSIHADAYEPLVLFYDRKAKRYVDVDLMILERGDSGERPIVQDKTYRGRRIKFVPDFHYTLYAKKEGYFSVYREFNPRNLMTQDTVQIYYMERTERGSSFPIKNVYFEDGEAVIIPGYDTALLDYVAMFLNHPEVTFMVKGYVQSYGVDIEADMLLSLERAKTVKQYFIDHGIEADRITTSGMTKNEIRRAAAAALDKGEGFSGIRVELIITGKKE